MSEGSAEVSVSSNRSNAGHRRVYFLILLSVCVPLFFLCAHSLSICPVQERTGMILMTVLAGLLGGGFGGYVIRGWEQRMRKAVSALVEQKCGQMQRLPPDQVVFFEQQMEQMRLGYEHQIDLLQSSVVKSKEQVQELHLEMDKKLEKMRVAYLEFEDLHKDYHALQEEYARYQAEIQGQLKHKDSLLADYQHTITEQREVIEKKQNYIGKLEGKVRDLMYEIRSLLQLEDPVRDAKENYLPDSQKGKPYDFSMQLSRFLELAESFTGADHLGGRFLNSGAHRYAIDLRPLFDKLSQETSRIVFVYSPSEDRFVFVGELIRSRLGWGPEKIIKDFHQLVVKGYREWKEAIGQLEEGQQRVLPLQMRHKMGQEVAVDCYMGLVAKGPFARYIIGMLI
ncbi:MAG: hypothetical protein JSS62_05415 [Verrucomicrobia bacterium]|nr:hypothetical protein [Verrucomicrobiota bacterium]MBS0646154.1 hypothetical protein [Verrucomicrobiota bacterium]